MSLSLIHIYAELILANGDLRLMDAAGAGAFTGRGTYPAGEFREAVGHQQTLRRRFPLAAVEQVVPFGNQVVKRTAGGQASDHQTAVAEGHGTAHAPRRLLPLLLLDVYKRQACALRRSCTRDRSLPSRHSSSKMGRSPPMPMLHRARRGKVFSDA